MRPPGTHSSPWPFWLLTTLSFAGLCLISFHNYLLFHGLVEGYAIVIAFSIFVVAWNSREFTENGYFLFLGLAFGNVALLDLIHTFAYKGMGVFQGGGGNLAAQLWIGARFLESASLLLAPLWLNRRLRVEPALAGFISVTALLLASIFAWRVFPDCFVPGVALTRFKIFSEYAISLVLMAAIGALWLRRALLDRRVFLLLSGAMAVSILSELAFTFYVSVYGLSNLLGHLLKILSFYLIYKALVETGLKRPYDLMFRELKESEARYRQVFETNQAVKLIIDPLTGTIVEANEAACRFYGYAREELLSRKITDINMLPPEKVREEMKRAQAEERIYFNFPHRLASGEIRDVHVYSGPVRTRGRTLLYSIIMDVTERNRAETRLKESEDRWRSLALSSPDHIVLLDENLKIEFANYASPGLTVEDLIGTEMWNYVEPERRGEVRSLLASVLAGGEPARYETTYQAPGEQTIHYESVVIPRRSGDRIVGLTLSARDITEQRKAEAERGLLESQLQQSRKMEAVGTLAGGIAHDINNILGIILGNTELAMADLSEERLAWRNLEQVRTASLRARDVVRQILRFSRQGESSLKPLAVAPVIEESVRLLLASLPASMEIRPHIREDVGTILGDATQIHQVMINLCTNAVHAMEEGEGVLDIHLENLDLDPGEVARHPDLSPGRFVRLRVSDNGEGMDPNLLERIFDPYFTTKETGRGTGMGLSVVHGIVRDHGGSISVESRPGEGTSMNVLFPVVEAEPEQEPERTGTLPTGEERILLVDDEEMLVRMGQQMLEGLGYRVETSTDPGEALERIRSEPGRYDLLLTDMTMPRLTGDRLIRKALEIRPDLPAILCTGYSEKMNDARAVEIGARALIMKPFQMETLAGTLRRVLDETGIE